MQENYLNSLFNNNNYIPGDTVIEIKEECCDIDGDGEQPNETPAVVQNGTVLVPMYVSNTQTFNLWTSKATACLISQYKKYGSLVGQTNQFRSLRDMFDAISVEMQKHGFFFSPQKCENKWRVLERKYKNLVTRKMLRKPGRIKHYGYWEHEKAMDEIFKEKNKSAYLLDDECPQKSPSRYAPILPKPGYTNRTNKSLLKVINDHGGNLVIDEDPLAATSNASVSSADDLESTQLAEKLLLEMKKLFELSEKNNERRHKEQMEVYQSQLKIQKRLLEIEEQKLNLEKKKLLAAVQVFQS